MILDGLLVFDQNAAVTASAPSTNTLDLLNARDLGIGDDPALKVYVHVATTFTAAGAATLVVQFQGSADNATWFTYAESRPYAIADLTAPRRLFGIDLPRPGNSTDPLPRYLRMNYVVATGPFTAGALYAAIVLDRQDNVYYPPGVTVNN